MSILEHADEISWFVGWVLFYAG